MSVTEGLPMPRRILAVVGSPRRNGNTHILVSKIAEGARAGGAVVEEEDLETAQGVVEFFKKSLAYLQIELLGQIIVPGVGEKGAVRRKPEYLLQACELGRPLA